MDKIESAYRTHESRATDERDLAYRMYREGVADTEARLAVAVEALKDLIVVAGNIRHWHDWGRDDEGMIVSSKSVRNLWTQTSKTQEALTKIGAKDDERKTMSEMTQNEKNKLIHGVVGGCEHKVFAEHREHPGPLRTCIDCGFTCGTMQAIAGCGVRDYFSPDLPDSIRVAVVKAFVDKHGTKRVYSAIDGIVSSDDAYEIPSPEIMEALVGLEVE